MSSTLNLLSDGTFASKIDEQNAILEDIRDNVGGGGSDLKTAAVRSDAPDSQGVSQFYKVDDHGNRTNVYPALSPVSGLGRYLFPDNCDEWSNDSDCFFANTYNPSGLNVNSIIPSTRIYKGVKSFITDHASSNFYYLWIKSSIIPAYDTNETPLHNLSNIFINSYRHNDSANANNAMYISESNVRVETFNENEYLVIYLNYFNSGEKWTTTIII